MPIGFSPSLPLRHDATDGFYKLNKTLGAVVKQNLKMIVLTTPGERIMHPDFGAGARNYLFDTKEESFQGLRTKIIQQARQFLPFIEITEINLADVNKRSYKDTNYMGLQIKYYISNLNLNDSLKITVSSKF
jgi:hypothetical protein